MSKKQYCSPKVQTLTLFNAYALCAGSDSPAPVEDNMSLKTDIATDDPW